MPADEADRYIQKVKAQQQRGLQKLKGDQVRDGAGVSYKVDPYTLRQGDYFVHKKVGIGRFVGIKYDVSKSSSEPIEYVFIDYADGMAKLPVNQAARMLYRYNLPNETKKPRSLSKLNDTSAWERRRIKGKIAVQKMVVDLMELYLHRLKQKRPPYPKTSAMAEFSSHFPYEPTPDQKQNFSFGAAIFLSVLYNAVFLSVLYDAGQVIFGLLFLTPKDGLWGTWGTVVVGMTLVTTGAVFLEMFMY